MKKHIGYPKTPSTFRDTVICLKEMYYSIILRPCMLEWRKKNIHALDQLGQRSTFWALWFEKMWKAVKALSIA